MFSWMNLNFCFSIFPIWIDISKHLDSRSRIKRQKVKIFHWFSFHCETKRKIILRENKIKNFNKSLSQRLLLKRWSNIALRFLWSEEFLLSDTQRIQHSEKQWSFVIFCFFLTSTWTDQIYWTIISFRSFPDWWWKKIIISVFEKLNEQVFCKSIAWILVKISSNTKHVFLFDFSSKFDPENEFPVHQTDKSFWQVSNIDLYCSSRRRVFELFSDWKQLIFNGRLNIWKSILFRFVILKKVIFTIGYSLVSVEI